MLCTLQNSPLVGTNLHAACKVWHCWSPFCSCNCKLWSDHHQLHHPQVCDTALPLHVDTVHIQVGTPGVISNHDHRRNRARGPGQPSAGVTCENSTAQPLEWLSLALQSSWPALFTMRWTIYVNLTYVEQTKLHISSTPGAVRHCVRSKAAQLAGTLSRAGGIALSRRSPSIKIFTKHTHTHRRLQPAAAERMQLRATMKCSLLCRPDPRKRCGALIPQSSFCWNGQPLSALQIVHRPKLGAIFNTW